MSTTLSLIRRILDQTINQGNLAVLDEELALDYHTRITIDGAPHGPPRAQTNDRNFPYRIPRSSMLGEDEIVESDKFAVRWSLHGTRQGMFLGNPPTGKQVNVPGIVFGRTENGRIIEDWTMIDQTSILLQMGLIPPLGRL